MLELLPGTYEVTAVVPDFTTVEGVEVGQEVKAKFLQNWEWALRGGQVWVEVGQRITVTKEDQGERSVWVVTCPRGGRLELTLSRKKYPVGGEEWLVEDIFEGGRIRTEVWGKRVGQEVWKKRCEDTILLDADKALVWEEQKMFTVEEVEVTGSRVIRTRRVEV